MTKNRTGKPVNISRHPLLKQAYELCLAIEELPAGLDQTALSVKASDFMDEIWNYFEEDKTTLKAVNTTPTHFDISDPDMIRRLGFEYAPDASKCVMHFYNNLPVEMDLRKESWKSVEAINKDLDAAFLAVLKRDIQSENIHRVHQIYWDRIFFIGENWDPREFTVRFYIRVLAEEGVRSTDNHVCQA